MLPLPPALPLAELEVGKHLYWQLGNLKIHGQVFLSSWVVIGALLAVVWIGTRKMDRDPRGVQNLLEFLWDYIRDLAREQIGDGCGGLRICKHTAYLARAQACALQQRTQHGYRWHSR